MGKIFLLSPLPPSPPFRCLYFQIIYGRLNKRSSFLTLTHTNKTPELQLPICLFLLRATDIANLHVISYHNLVNAL